MPVGDVLRGAVAEIEDFQRVDVTLDGEADLNGRAVVDVVHLIAELIENATVFSGPLTRVAVHGAPVSNGYQITVTDRGVGLGAAELLGQALAAPAVPVEAFAPPPCPSKRGRRPPLTRRSTRGRLSQPRSTRGRSSRRCQKPWPKFRSCWWSRFRPAAP